MRCTAFKFCFQIQLAPLHHGHRPRTKRGERQLPTPRARHTLAEWQGLADIGRHFIFCFITTFEMVSYMVTCLSRGTIDLFCNNHAASYDAVKLQGLGFRMRWMTW